MGIKARDAGNTLRTITQIRVRDAGNVLRTIQRVRIRDAGNVLRTVWEAASGLAFSVTPGDTYNTRSGGGSLTSSASSGTATGGTPGYTYAWAYVSGNSYTINSPTSASTTFTTTLASEQFKLGVYRLTVTDAAAATISADVMITLESL